ncbi:MAG: hypothetical protein K8F91_12030, partial [Candidatus Obscuribacterales bacterium]|nr:hypothetical protein [Candidatus Obscuribacterales bacterium]
YVRSFHEMPEAELEKGALQAAPSGEEAAAPKADDSKKAESAETTKPEINTDQPNDKDQAPVGSGAAEPTSR